MNIVQYPPSADTPVIPPDVLFLQQAVPHAQFNLTNITSDSIVSCPQITSQERCVTLPSSIRNQEVKDPITRFERNKEMITEQVTPCPDENLSVQKPVRTYGRKTTRADIPRFNRMKRPEDKHVVPHTIRETQRLTAASSFKQELEQSERLNTYTKKTNRPAKNRNPIYLER